MVIEDMEGNQIAELGPGKSKGINVVNWNYTRKTPKVAKGKTFSFGGFTAPQVPAGTYKAVITKGKETFEHTFNLVNDKNSPLSAKDRELKEATTMKLYNMTQELAYLVYELDQIVENAATKGDKKTKEKLNNLKETLVITTGDNYVGAAEPQLRERMADLYSKVASSYDKPSAAELKNFEVITERFNNAKKEFAKLKDKYLKKQELALMSFEDFLESK